MSNKDKLPNLLVNHVVLENTTINKDNQVAHPVVLENTIISKDKLLNLLVNHVVLEHTTINKDKLPNLVANHVVLGNTTTNKDNQVVNHVVLGNTTIKQVKLLHLLHVKIAMQENIKTKREKHRVKCVPAILTALLVRQVVCILQLLVLSEPLPMVPVVNWLVTFATH